MKLQKRLSNLLFILILTLVSASAFAETKWEVGAIFLGARENEEYQKDVEANLKEIAQIGASSHLRVSTYRERASIPDHKKLLAFLKTAFKDPQAKKVLVFYGHGQGPEGLRDMSTSEIKGLLKNAKTHFDILWFDACFLANLEFLYEMRNSSTFTIASEEAEFSSGLPFESLGELPQYSSEKEAALMLAKSFIESYSYLKEGRQREAVSMSSATISVIENSELSSFVESFKKIPSLLSSLRPEVLLSLRSRLQKNFSMDHSELVDLGSLLIELRAAIKDSKKDQEITPLIRLLNIDSVKKLKTNPRIKIVAPAQDALMVFGFNHWENGHQEEYLDNPIFKNIIATKTFIDGPQGLKWPVKKFESKTSTLSPFAPGIQSFNYYFLDKSGKNLLSEALSVTRSLDIVETQRSKESSGGFLLYSAYTQRVGRKAEKYTGINIALFQSAPSMDYFELEFNQMVSWLKL